MVKNPDQTRQMLLTTAFHEFHRHGYQAAGLDSILKVAGVTKGALYHHFANKQELGLAVVDEVLAPWIRSTWIEPLERPGNPVDGLLGSLRCVVDKATAETMECGCPLNNLAQEMSPIDEAFRGRLEGIFVEWRSAIAAALRRGRSDGQVRRSIDPEITAAFIVAAFEGAIGSVKASRSLPLGRQIVRGLEEYIESLRPTRRRKAS
jgi:AcrR family transcriptional regulator